MEQPIAIKSNIDRFLQELENLIESDSAYGSSVNLLACKVDTLGETIGRFRDAWNNRIFDYTLNSKGLSYKPSLNLDSKLDSWEAVNLLEMYSAGYLSVSFHLDAVKKRTKKPKCGNTNYNCGLSCIGVTKNCQIDSGLISRDRINKLQKLAEAIAFDQVKLKGVGKGFIKPSDLIQLSRELQKQRVVGTKGLSDFNKKSTQSPKVETKTAYDVSHDEAVKDFLTPKNIKNGQLVDADVSKSSAFNRVISSDYYKVRPYEILPNSNTAPVNSSLTSEIAKSVKQLKFNLAIPLVCLTNEEEKYDLVTGNSIVDSFRKTNTIEHLWATVVPTLKKNALVLADDYARQSRLNTPSDISVGVTTKEEAVKQVSFDYNNPKVTAFNKEGYPSQPAYIFLNQFDVNVGSKKYSDQIESEINLAAKSMKELQRNLSTPLCCLTKQNDKYQLVSGELLLEAARRAGLDRIQVMVLNTTAEYAAHFLKDFEVQNRASRERSE